MNQLIAEKTSHTSQIKNRKKILFANIPADGHFYPLTTLAVHLKKQGHDVRWYTGPSYAEKIAKLGIPYYLFNIAKEVTVHNIDEVFPERKQIKNHVKKVTFDICSYFIQRGEEFYQDIKDINDSFDFDILIADNAFTGISFTRKLLKKETVVIGVMPLNETSKDLPPTIMGLTPFTSFLGKKLQSFLRFITNNVLLKEPNQLMRKIHARYGIDTGDKNILDAQVMLSSLYLQSGTPGFEYHRSDLSKHIHFIGPLLPHKQPQTNPLSFEDKLRKYDKVILVTQGTFERDSTADHTYVGSIQGNRTPRCGNYSGIEYSGTTQTISARQCRDRRLYPLRRDHAVCRCVRKQWRLWWRYYEHH